MNHFERVAVFTVIENMESQLKGLKTLIAAASSPTSPATHKTTQTLETDSQELSEEEELRLEEALKAAQDKEVKRMRQSAETHFQKEWDLAAKTMTTLDQLADG